MKIIVGRTVNTVCSRSGSIVGSRAEAWTRASRVASWSTAAPQFEQKRTLGVTYAPHLEHVMNLSSLSWKSDALVLSLLIIPKASSDGEAKPRRTSGGKADPKCSVELYAFKDWRVRSYWLTSWSWPSGRRTMKTLRS